MTDENFYAHPFTTHLARPQRGPVLHGSDGFSVVHDVSEEVGLHDER